MSINGKHNVVLVYLIQWNKSQSFHLGQWKEKKLIHAITWMNLKNIVLSDVCGQIQKATLYDPICDSTCDFIPWNVQNRQSYRDRK